MERIGSSKVIVKKSKFFGYLFKIERAEDLNDVVELIRNDNLKAVHVCYGAVVDGEEFFKNDGEVGNPGRLLLSVLKNGRMKSHALVVARYYGGVKLGPAGVGKAFRNCGNATISTGVN